MLLSDLRQITSMPLVDILRCPLRVDVWKWFRPLISEIVDYVSHASTGGFGDVMFEDLESDIRCFVDAVDVIELAICRCAVDSCLHVVSVEVAASSLEAVRSWSEHFVRAYVVITTRYLVAYKAKLRFCALDCFKFVYSVRMIRCLCRHTMYVSVGGTQCDVVASLQLIEERSRQVFVLARGFLDNHCHNWFPDGTLADVLSDW